MSAWIIDRLLPGLTAGFLLGSVTYIKLHFEKAWPYWGRNKRKHDAER